MSTPNKPLELIPAHQAPRLAVIIGPDENGTEVIGIVMTEYENRRDGLWVEVLDRTPVRIRRDAEVRVVLTAYGHVREWLKQNVSSNFFQKGGDSTDGNAHDGGSREEIGNGPP